jgi:hypothetical protein
MTERNRDGRFQSIPGNAELPFICRDAGSLCIILDDWKPRPPQSEVLTCSPNNPSEPHFRPASWPEVEAKSLIFPCSATSIGRPCFGSRVAGNDSAARLGVPRQNFIGNEEQRDFWP